MSSTVSTKTAPQDAAASRTRGGQRPSRTRGLRRRGEKHLLAPYIFIAPFTILFVLFVVAPIVVAGWTSLFATTKSGLGFSGSVTSFVGLQNYITALQNPNFFAGFGRVLLFGIVQVPVMLGFALILALLFDSAAVRLKRFFQLVVFLPYAVPVVIAALLWGFLYQPGVSPIVQGLRSIGIPADFLAPGTVLWSIANISTWAYVGVNMIIMFTGLQSIPRELYEAARIDGASELRTAFTIKVPLIAPSILLTTLFSIIGTLQLFNEPTVLKAITSNVSSDYTPNMAIYETTTSANNINLGSAMAILLGLITLILSIGVSRATNRRAES